MLRVEVVEHKTNQRSYVSFFDDDTIDTVRSQIGRALDIHPDRLFVLANIERPKDYYQRNPQYWETLFHRLSFTEKLVQRKPFSEYQTFYRSPTTSIVYEEIDRSSWMEVPDSVKELHQPTEAFSEYMIFGVPTERSFILPREYDNALVFQIPTAQYPIPDTSALVCSLYDVQSIRSFYVIPYEETAEQVATIYFPFLRDITPPRLSEAEVNLLKDTETKIEKLLELKAPQPTSVAILRTRFYVPWIETDFGSAIRTRFEQIFYGLTMSPDVPCITYFTSTAEVSRHKFYVKDPKNKVPFVDLQTWNGWWNTTKPSRNRPTLVIYSGTSPRNFNRIAITSADMTISTYRDEDNKETIEELQDNAKELLSKLDSVLAFTNPNDIDVERWELQDMSFLATYSKKLEGYDLRRFSCVSSIFDLADPDKSIFRFLRTDFSVRGISAVEMKVLQLMRDNPSLTPNDVSIELSIPLDKARVLFRQIESKLEDDPDILNKAFRGFPTMRLGPNNVLLSFTSRFDKPLQFANILRYILTSPDAKDLDDVCPKRMEKIETKNVKVEEENVDDAILDEYADFADLVETEPVKDEEIIEPEPDAPEKFIVKTDRKTLYNYFNARLQKFDPETYNSNHPEYKYPKQCEHQPVVLSSKDIQRIQGSPYDPREYLADNEQMIVENPDGILVCPAFWCIRDEIPLRADQLINDDGFERCPICKGKVSDKKNINPQEYSVVKRDEEFKYPGLTKYKSPQNDKVFPCCYKTPAKGEKKKAEDKYYILGEGKNVPPKRLAFIPKSILDGLKIKEDYEAIRSKSRLEAPHSAFFRVGIGRPSETLPMLLKLKSIPKPIEAPNLVMKCSFFSTWIHLADKDYEKIQTQVHSEQIARRIVAINTAFEKGELSVIQELEYTALALQCDVFRIIGTSMECFFQTRIVRPRQRGIIVLQSGNVINVVSNVMRKGNNLHYSSNVFDKPFTDETAKHLEILRNSSCKSSIPTFDNALNVLQELGLSDFSIILDPFAKAQAIYIPNKLILPFQSSAIPTTDKPELKGFEDAKELPTHTDVLKYLEIAQKYSSGYAWAEDLVNSNNERVELRLVSGLRIPVVPEVMEEAPNEVIETVNTIGERNMTFESEDDNLQEVYRNISYASEIFDFLLFELSKTLEDNPELERILRSSPNRQSLEPVLRKWFENTTQFVDIANAVNFISKVRTPCGQFTNKQTCNGNVCGWDGKTCRVNIKSSLKKETIFHRLVSELVENQKIRGIVLEGRITTFFSTILFVELPNELILTDVDVKG